MISSFFLGALADAELLDWVEEKLGARLLSFLALFFLGIIMMCDDSQCNITIVDLRV